MPEKERTMTTGIGSTGVLTIVFIVLKLTKVINWRWVYVLSPIWISASFAMIIILLVLIVAFTVSIIQRRRS